MTSKLGNAVAVLCGACAAAWIAGAPAQVGAEEPMEPRVAEALASARSAADGLASEIRALLVRELQGGGPRAAVVACARSAQSRTEDYRRRTGVDIRRVSLRYRNAVNAPDAYERAVLESFDRLAPDARPAAEHWQLTATGERRELRYLRPLVANAMCLGCHGPRAALSEGVRAALAKEYPDDRATGFAAGDVRGAIAVRVPVTGAEPPAPR